jgi:hypothetical protein
MNQNKSEVLELWETQAVVSLYRKERGRKSSGVVFFYILFSINAKRECRNRKTAGKRTNAANCHTTQEF